MLSSEERVVNLLRDRAVEGDIEMDDVADAIEALAAERDEWKRIAEWLSENVERVPFEFSGNLAEYRSRMTAARIRAAREAVSSPATTTTKEEGL